MVTGKNSFKVPKYQRNYSWDEENQEDLWRDLENIGSDHFFGTIILEETDEDGAYNVVDGQQRLTTVLILLNELARKLEKEDSENVDEIRDYYIFGPSSRFKLKLMGDDGGFFKDYLEIEAEEDIETVLSQLDSNSPSQKRLRNAIVYFNNKLEEKEEEISNDEFDNFQVYCENLQEIIESLELMVYPVESRTRAVQVFSITNDRGKILTNLEKTKSFLMEQIFTYREDEEEQEEDIKLIQRKFQEMYEFVDKINDKENIPNFKEDRIQRFHFILWDKQWTGAYEKRYYQRHFEELKKRFRDVVEDSEEEEILQNVLDYTKDLWHSFLDLYRLLLRKKEDTKIDSDIEAKVERLLAIGRLGNFYPLLITSYRKYEEGDFSKEDFLKILDRIETFIFRVYSVKQRPANTARIPFYKLARKVHTGGVSAQQTLTGIGADTILSKLEEEIHDRCPDETLREILQRNDLFDYYGSGRKDELRYLLYFYESKLEEEGYEGLNPPLLLFVKNKWHEKPSGEEVTIEHIWPQNSDQLNLSEEEEDEHEDCVNKLGNLAYMTGPWNKSKQNQAPDNKVDSYQASKVRMLNAAAETIEEEGWRKKQIVDRENEMIEKILKIWPDPESI
ncbi:hypothetical protein AKJ36_00135 [candidate division MSBL1 archaeon SCGC-AAA259I07]|uniref:DUF262 domain-containing protein n=1 Tax=candidate division MSBL1 archaeon SCGC-AAA259I07 TaxID=1698266 RepID=A0A133UN56_9EURY|nr:hypothetical protein AKJ36_00135 [candidate division MSBL1 archaeon SCGC-AAA259I07]